MGITKWVRLGSLLTFAPIAWAHAVLLESTPAVGAVVAGAEVPITLRFNSRIDAKRSRLSVACAIGTEQVLAIDSQTAPDRITGLAKDLQTGSCRIRWQVLASDGHITRGTLPFQVK